MKILMQMEGELILYCDTDEIQESVRESQDRNRQRDDIYQWHNNFKGQCQVSPLP